jgi:hypothetical protein
MRKVISASRRTDLPAFHYDWLQNALERGEVLLNNPRFKEKVYSVDLTPEHVHSIVLWSKDFSKVADDPGHLANGMINCRVTVSYVCLYSHVKTRLKSQALEIIDYTQIQQLDFFRRLAGIANHFGITLYSCALPLLEHVEGIVKGSCIDGKHLEHLFDEKVTKAKDTGQRTACSCTKSSDIGMYTQDCGFGCTYCYSGIWGK